MAAAPGPLLPSLPSVPRALLHYTYRCSLSQSQHLHRHRPFQGLLLSSPLCCDIRDICHHRRVSNHAFPLCLRDSLPAELPDGSHGTSYGSLAGWHYEVATRFIDDKLLDAVTRKDVETRQIVLLTDGMDTRPYRLPWPPATMIFDVSSDPVFKLTKEKLSVVEAKVPKLCLFRHVSAELAEATDSQEGWIDALKRVGYQGDRPSIWAMQGLDHLKWRGLQDILMSVSSLAMKGSVFLGELPANAIGAMPEETGKQKLEKVFMSHGFNVHSLSYEKLAQHLGYSPDGSPVDGVGNKRFFFVAQQLRLSDDQVAKAVREMELAEEAGDEETFEDW